jgi:hypothetical protein
VRAVEVEIWIGSVSASRLFASIRDYLDARTVWGDDEYIVTTLGYYRGCLDCQWADPTTHDTRERAALTHHN